MALFPFPQPRTACSPNLTSRCPGQTFLWTNSIPCNRSTASTELRPSSYQRLSHFLRRDAYQNIVPSLKSRDVTWLVEYLDSVSLRIISFYSMLNTYVGSHGYFRPYNVPGILARTQKTVRCQGGAPGIMYFARRQLGH